MGVTVTPSETQEGGGGLLRIMIIEDELDLT